MSPRYLPTRERRELIAAGAVRPPEAVDRVEPTPLVRPETLRRRGTADPYDPRSGFSFFRDLLREADARERSAKALQSGALRGRDQGEGAVPAGLRADGTLADVRERLQVGRELGLYERRDITSAFDVSGGSIHVNSAFATSARAQGTILAALPTQPLPDQGEVVKIPRLTGGSSVAVQATENHFRHRSRPDHGRGELERREEY